MDPCLPTLIMCLPTSQWGQLRSADPSGTRLGKKGWDKPTRARMLWQVRGVQGKVDSQLV